jgi:hypothetical protein
MLWELLFGSVAAILINLTVFAVFFLIRLFILRASCAVADVKEPSYGLAALLVLGVVLIGGVVSFGIDVLLDRFTADPTILFGPLRITGIFLSMAIGWALAAVLYRLVLTSSLLRSLTVAGIEVLLNGLVTALLLMVLLVGYSIWQLFWHPAPQQTPPRAAAALIFRDPRS